MHAKKTTWILIILLLSTISCSLLDRFTADTSPQTSMGADAATKTPLPTLPPTGETAERVQEATPPSASVSQPEATAFTGITGLDNLSSYRVTFVMDFDGISDGQPSVGRVEMVLENTSDPPARHLSLTMEGTMLEDVGGYNRTEFYEAGGKIYLYNEARGEGQWISMEGDGASSDAFRIGFFAPDEDLELPKTAVCDTSPEVVNNVSAIHCSFTDSDVESTQVTYESLSGNVWIAEEGSYIVKYNLEAADYQNLQEDDGLFDVGDVFFEYNLMDINAAFPITPPEEALNADGLDFGSLGDSGAETETPELPVLDDAEELYSMSGLTTYYTNAEVAAVVDFYRQLLPANGWQEDENGAFVDETTGLLSFVKEGQALTITMSKENERTTVGLIVTGQ